MLQLFFKQLFALTFSKPHRFIVKEFTKTDDGVLKLDFAVRCPGRQRFVIFINTEEITRCLLIITCYFGFRLDCKRLDTGGLSATGLCLISPNRQHYDIKSGLCGLVFWFLFGWCLFDKIQKGVVCGLCKSDLFLFILL